MDIVWRGILIGIGATIVMDLWALLLAAMPGQARQTGVWWDAGFGIFGMGGFSTTIFPLLHLISMK